MLTGAKNLFRFLRMNIKCNLLAAMEYKKSFLIQSIFMFINNAFFLVFWFVMFDANEGNINGIEMNDILYLWSLPTMAYGIAYFVFGGVYNLGKYLIEGTLDTFLVQPKNIILNVATSQSSFSAFGDLIYGMVIGIFAVQGDILEYILLLVISIIASVFYICTETIIRLLAVWIGNTDNIDHVYTNSLLINFSTYPEAIYGSFTKFLIYTVIPSAYIAFIPIKFVTTLNFKYLAILIAVAGFYIGLTALICQKALKKYESGNGIGLKG